jgi:peptide/nickel transport system permease protein
MVEAGRSFLTRSTRHVASLRAPSKTDNSQLRTWPHSGVRPGWGLTPGHAKRANSSGAAVVSAGDRRPLRRYAPTDGARDSSLVSTTAGKDEYLGATSGVGTDVVLDLIVDDSEIRARGYWEQVWRRFKRDRVAIGSIFFLIFVVLVCYPGAWIAERLIGHGPEDPFPDGIDDGLIPVGPMTEVVNPFTGDTQILLLGASDTLGRDEFLRLLYGGRVSLQVAVFSTIGVMLIGTILGAAAGYFRGWIDTVISRLTEITMAFPVLLFVIALASTAGSRLNGITFGGVLSEGVVTLVLVFWIFFWFYPARIIRAKVLSLREKEFVEAAHMTGASDLRIIRSHLLPHLLAPIIVYSTLVVATFILAEAALSFLGVGIPLPTASWGNLLSTAPEFYTSQPWLMLWPGLAVVLTTLAFNLLGDGLRDAFDPRARL